MAELARLLGNSFILWKRRKLNARWVTEFSWSIFRFILVFGICFIILFPFIKKLFASFMSPMDLVDPTVKFIARNPSLYFYRAALKSIDFSKSFIITLFLSLITSTLQMMVSTFVGYGFARFRSRFSNVVLGLVIFTLLVPPQLILTPLFLQFRFFNIFFMKFNLIDTFYPFIILAVTGLGIKNGLYVYMMRQFFRGMPVELEEAAYVDGVGVFKTFFYIMLPNALPMMVTVFLFSFAWQWTDILYVDTFFSGLFTLPKAVVQNIGAINADLVIANTTRNTAALIVIAPLLLMYIFAQKTFVQSVERSGLVG